MGTATPEKRTFARIQRHNPTPSESRLWSELRAKRLSGIKFRRQHPLFGFIVDFYCAKVRLAVELDGDCHDEAYDRERDRILGEQHIRVLRFRNEELMDVSRVLETIAAACTPRRPWAD